MVLLGAATQGGPRKVSLIVKRLCEPLHTAQESPLICSKEGLQSGVKRHERCSYYERAQQVIGQDERELVGFRVSLFGCKRMCELVHCFIAIVGSWLARGPLILVVDTHG